MKLEDGIKFKGRPFNIPDCSRDDLPEFWKSLGFKVGVEIGVYMADYTRHIAQSGLEIYGVDPWKIYRDFGSTKGQERQERIYQITKKRLDPYPNAHIIRKTSMEAVKDFAPNSIDFVYIDGNHLFRHVADDIYEWAIRVRPGGIISGHDYAYYASKSLCGGCHAHQIIDAYVHSYRIENFWVIGRREVIEGEKRDHYRSWFWFKNYETPTNPEGEYYE